MTKGLHGDVRRFLVRGTIKSSKDFSRLQQEYRRIIIDVMRLQGYVEMVGWSPQFSTSWKEDDSYEFIYSMCGIYIGIEESCKATGMDYTGRLIMAPAKLPA